MKLCFYTMSNAVGKYMDFAGDLLYSAKTVGRSVYYFRVPGDYPEHPKRYKMELMVNGMLPEADKYVYLDADTIMLKRGQWESDKIMGTNQVGERSHVLKFKSPDHQKTFKQWCLDHGAQESNTGCVVIPGEILEAVGTRWKFWCKAVDDLLLEPSCTKDQFHFRFVKKEFKLPNLNPEYLRSTCKNNITPETVQIQMSGLPRGREVYKEYQHKLYGCYMAGARGKDKELSRKLGMNDGFRSRMIADLIIRYAENPTYPVGAEIGVGRGKNARWLVGMFPGMKLYCVDPWEDVKESRFKWSGNYHRFSAVQLQHPNQIIEHKCKSLECKLDDPLDFVFIDADHRTENVVDDIRYWTLKVKNGGIISGHDLDYKGKYYGKDSVRNALDISFGKGNWNKGPGHLWWRIKDGTDLRIEQR